MGSMKQHIENMVLEHDEGAISIEDIKKYYANTFYVDLKKQQLEVIRDYIKENYKNYQFSPIHECFETNAVKNDYLYVSDNKYFKLEIDAINFVMKKNLKGIQKATYPYDSNTVFWFPKFNGEDWLNIYENDTWKEKDLKSETQMPSDNKLRIVFEKVDDGYKFTGIFKFSGMTEDHFRLYKMVDDKIAIISEIQNIMICNISYMKEYKGITDADSIQGGGGKYPSQNKDGGEKLNFLPNNDGKIYGFVETNYKDSEHLGNPKYAKNIKLENINPIFKKEDIATNVRVVFISKGPSNKTNVVVGWYENATVYRERQITSELYGYNITCNSSDAYLLPESDRVFSYPKINDDGSYNFGQCNYTFPRLKNNKEGIKLDKDLNDFINNYEHKKLAL